MQTRTRIGRHRNDGAESDSLNIDEREPASLPDLLKPARRRIDPEARSLGPQLRFPSRIGKAVTQDEVAEALGISRNWYQMLETKQGIRVSATLLGRIADTLMLDAAERSVMFNLAVPELRSMELKRDSYQVIEAFRALRKLGQTLWTATSEAEALTLVREYGASQFDSDLFVTIARDDAGRWRDAAGIGKPGALKRLERFVTFPSANFDPLFVDAVHLYPILVQPGEVLTRSDRLTPGGEFVDKFSRTMDVVGWRDHDFMSARVRSRLGFVANIAIIHETRRGFTDVEREHLSAIAQLVSHALSGAAPE